MNKKTMTPNDEFAKAAMQSYMINCDAFKVEGGYIANAAYSQLAKYSYEIADEMMKQKYKRDTNLCNNCKLHPATCMSEPSFGLGIGYDNVIKCNVYLKKDGYKIRTFFRHIYFATKNRFLGCR